MKRNCCAFLLITFLVTASGAKNEPAITMLWPPDKPALKLGFDKFHQVSVYAGQSVFISDVTVQNLTDKQILRAAFTVYFMDKNKVRIGLHPDDPPVASLGCVARVFRTYAAYERAFEIAGSDNFGVCLCIGTWGEGGRQGFGKGWK